MYISGVVSTYRYAIIDTEIGENITSLFVRNAAGVEEIKIPNQLIIAFYKDIKFVEAPKLILEIHSAGGFKMFKLIGGDAGNKYEEAKKAPGEKAFREGITRSD